MFGSMSSFSHEAHIALSRPMTSIVKQGSNLGAGPTFSAQTPHYNLVMFWPFDPAKNAIHGDAPEGGDTF